MDSCALVIIFNEETVYNFVQVISEHYPEIQKKNPNLKGVPFFGPEINVIPLHSGVIRYYKNSH